MNEKPTLNIVLVEPRIPQNTGNVARTCACTACRLHLVGPMGFAIDDKKLKHAGLDYWHYLDISYYDRSGRVLCQKQRPLLLFYHQGTAALHRCELPGRCIPRVRTRGCRPARSLACRQSGALHPNAHARHLPQPEPFQQRGRGRV